MQNLGGQTKSIMVFSKVAYFLFSQVCPSESAVVRFRTSNEPYKAVRSDSRTNRCWGLNRYSVHSLGFKVKMSKIP